MREVFFALEPKDGESSAKFVLRLEQTRRNLGISPIETFHSFVKGLDYEMRKNLD